MNALEELKNLMRNTDGVFAEYIIQEVKCLVPRIEAEYMKLPRDKNGDVIHIGDTLTCHRLDNKKHKVIGVIGNVDVLLSWHYQVRADDCELVKPEPPDSMERIKKDAGKLSSDYFRCSNDCDACEATIDGKTPRQRYGVEYCNEAMHLDLIARTEKLLGGDAECMR